MSTVEMDVGFITNLNYHQDGYTIIFSEPDSEYEIGIGVYKKDLNLFPMIGDKIQVVGAMTDDGILSLVINDEIQFVRDPIEAKLWREIRSYESKIDRLKEELRKHKRSSNGNKNS